MKTKSIIFLIASIAFFTLNACGLLIFRKIECRDFLLVEEMFWFQGKTDKSYVLVNEKTGQEKTFTVDDQWISHRKEYASDTGCGCYDVSSQLLVGKNDSIWTSKESRYIERQEPDRREAITLVFDGAKTIFNSLNSSNGLKNELVNDMKVETKTLVHSRDNSEIKLGKGIGVIHIKLPNNEIWRRKNLRIEPIAKIEDYRFMFNECN